MDSNTVVSTILVRYRDTRKAYDPMALGDHPFKLELITQLASGKPDQKAMSIEKVEDWYNLQVPGHHRVYKA